MANAQRTLALFDFDGTISRRDTLFLFLRHTHRQRAFLKSMVTAVPCLAKYAVGITSATTAKEGLLQRFYAGWHRDELMDQGRRFAEALASGMDVLHEPVLARLREHADSGDTVCIVSASPAVWVRPFAEIMRLDVIATELEFDQHDRFSGRLAGANMSGPEKALAIRARYNLHDFERVVAFGNSRGDFEMLNLAHEAYLVQRSGTLKSLPRSTQGS